MCAVQHEDNPMLVDVDLKTIRDPGSISLKDPKVGIIADEEE